MFSPRWRKAIGDLWLHKGRTLVVVVAIAVGLAGAGAILNAWALVRVATREGFRASDPASATLKVDTVDAALLARVRAVPGVREVQARRVTVARARVASGTVTAVLFTVPDFDSVRIGRVTPIVGVWPPADGTVTIETSSVEFSGAGLDDAVALSFDGGRETPTRVGGIVRDVTLAPGWMEHVVYGFVSRATLERVGASTAFNELQFVVADRRLDQDGVRRIAASVKYAVETAGHRVLDVDVPVPGEHIHAAQMDSLLYTQGVFALMALLLSAFLVVNLIAAMLAGQTRDIGVMKAIGAQWHQLTTMYLSMAVLLGVAASVLAVPLALVAGRQYAGVKAEMLNFDITGFAVPMWVIVVQIMVGVLLPVLAAAFPVWRACRLPVNDALRDVGIASGSSTDGWVYRVGGLSRPILFSLRNAFRRRQRMLLTLLAIASGGAVFLGALNLRASVLGATELIFGSHRFDFSLRLSQPADADSVQAIVRALDGVAAAEVWSSVRASVDHQDGGAGNTFVITALPPASDMLVPHLVEGRWLRDSDARALVVNRSARREDSALTVGATVQMTIGARTEPWLIVGLVESTPAPAAYAPRETLRAMNGDGWSSVVVRSAIAGEASQLDLVQRLRGTLSDAGIDVTSSSMVADARRSTEDHLLMVVDFLGGMGWLMLLVGGLGLASTMGLAVLERTREIGVLRAIGARHSAIHTMIQFEGLTIALLSWALAIPLSIPMSVMLARAFSRIMLPVPVTYVPNTVGVLIWLALVVVVSLVACAWPAVRAMRVPTAAALAYD